MEKSEIVLLVNATSVFSNLDMIPTVTTTFSTTVNLNMTTSTLPGVGDYRFKMAATKPELEITFER